MQQHDVVTEQFGKTANAYLSSAVHAQGADLVLMQECARRHGKPVVLDLGCGGGEPVARYLIEEEYAVTGVDSSAALLEQCRQRFPQQQWLNADMRGLALDRDFDGILAWNSLFHLSPDDQRAMFAVFERHARPGCALMFTSGPQAGEAIGEFEGEALYHASLDPGEYCTLLDTHCFEVVQQVSEDPDCCGLTVWLARAMDFG